jgi:endonuclease YncB( thermonuclease family)
VLVVSEVSEGDTVLNGLEKEARKAREGLWADPQPMPLWEWRKK